MTISFQNCGMATSAGDGSLQTTSTSNKALGTYDPSSIDQLTFSITGGMRMQVPSTTAIIHINLSSSPAGISLSEQSVDSSKPAQSCAQYAPMSDAELKTLLTYLNQARLNVKPASSGVAVDCGIANLSVRLKDSSEHSYQFESVCTAPGALMIHDENNVLGNLLSHYLSSMLCMADN